MTNHLFDIPKHFDKRGDLSPQQSALRVGLRRKWTNGPPRWPRPAVGRPVTPRHEPDVTSRERIAPSWGFTRSHRRP
jgi:hypothetical protein